MRAKKLRDKRNAALAKAAAVHEAAGDSVLTAEQQAEFDSAMAEAEALAPQIAEAETLEAAQAEAATVEPAAGRAVGAGAARAQGPEAAREFSEVGEYILAVMGASRPGGRVDPRLQWHDAAPSAIQSMGVGLEGGFLVPRVLSDRLAAVRVERSVIRPGAIEIGAEGAYPDAAVDVPALDQGTGSNIFGGVSVSWIDEGQAKPETDVNFRNIALQPKEVAAHVVATDKSLRNAPALAGVVGERLLAAMVAAEDFAFIRGNGVGQPRGIITGSGRLAVTRATANQITFADVTAMVARILMDAGSTPVWLFSQACLPQLANLRDPAGNLIWQANARDGFAGTLMGYPAIMLNRMPILGAVGDIALVDRGQYIIKDGFGPIIAASPHPQFVQNRTVIKGFWNVDGSPVLATPVADENGYQVSPYVVLS